MSFGMSAVDLLCWGIMGVWRRWRWSQQEPLCAVCCKTFASAQRIFRGSPVFCSGGDRDARATARATAREWCKYHWIEQCQRRDWSVTCFKLFCVPTQNVSLVVASICICCIYTINSIYKILIMSVCIWCIEARHDGCRGSTSQLGAEGELP